MNDKSSAQDQRRQPGTGVSTDDVEDETSRRNQVEYRGQFKQDQTHTDGHYKLTFPPFKRHFRDRKPELLGYLMANRFQ